MGHHYASGNRLTMNGRWLFDDASDQIRDVQNSQFCVALSPIAARLLGVLIVAPNMVLRRQSLIDDGWRRFGFEVGENSLNQVICSLRSAFEQLPTAQPAIKTIPRIGYCFLADVHHAADDFNATARTDRRDVNPGRMPATENACVEN